ncbi:MAG: 2-hydroxyacyl-CoA dehydratase [Oscillospiraceae bacterium]|nr:2-hydroxyacyl-CoA dehydratase [Oscillospiraceae bacterium]
MQGGRIEFSKDMKKDYTILIPNMLSIHFRLFERIFHSHGYNVQVLKNDGPNVVSEGLKHVHNDTCYPALLVIGQMLDALGSGRYDLNKTALMITQTGGGCRASNYIHLLRKALVSAGYAHIPVISLNMSGLEKNSGFKLTFAMIKKIGAAAAYGDLLMLLDNQVKPYETISGSSSSLVEYWVNEITARFDKGRAYSQREIKNNLGSIVKSFAQIEREDRDTVKVGIVGEIFVKYAPLGNNHLEEFLYSQGCEVMVPGVIAFVLFKTDNRIEDIKLYGGSRIKHMVVSWLLGYLTRFESFIIDAVRKEGTFAAPSPYSHMKTLVKDVVGYGNKMGEGWLLTAEMLELIEMGYGNIVCAQPFGCLPNHIVGKGMIRKIRELHPESNIVPIDYDPGATKVNQENRIKLMLAVGAER